MNEDLMMRLFFCAVASLLFSWVVFSGNDPDVGENNRYSNIVPAAVLPLLLIILFLLSIPTYGASKSLELTASMCFSIFLQIGIYDILLLLLLPLLRQKINARSCAALWLLPNLLYLTQTSAMVPSRPLWIIQIPERLLTILTWIWLAGFLGILIWQIGVHLLFRHQILKAAKPVTEPEILSLWKEEQQAAQLKKAKLKLLHSPAVRTPLSIGLFRCTTRVVLPEADYTPSELHLIFQHELIHILREDALSKFFLLFCTAVCWFNPFLWIAKRKSADDLELSCDEAVLLGADQDTRIQYADLLLKTAGQEQGFTTCLSASASALRYRLKNTVKPRKLASGALIMGLICFILLSTSGYVALAYGTSTGEELIFNGQDQNTYSLRNIHNNEAPYTERIRLDEQGLKQYLAQLPLQTLTGTYSFPHTSHNLTLFFDTSDSSIPSTAKPEDIALVILKDDVVEVAAPDKKPDKKATYYVPGGIDWSVIDRALPQMPVLTLRFCQMTGYSDTTRATLSSVIWVQDSNRTTLKQLAPSEGSVSGTFGQSLFYESMELDFSTEPIDGFTVTIESWDRQQKTVLTQDDLEVPNVVPLPDHDAHYTIEASFPGPDGSIYEAVFCYDLGTT